MNLENLYPFRSQYLPLGNWNYHYIDEGKGEPFLLVHGNPSWSFLYRDIIRAFSDRYRMIAPDHIGCGLSDKPDTASYSYRLEQRIKDLEQLIDHLDLHDITLVVHDWGGMIGLSYAVRRPERIKRLILFNTAAFPKPAKKRMPLSITLCRQPIIGPILVQGFNAFSRGAARYCTERELSQDEKEGYLYPYKDWESRRAIYEFVKDIPLKPSDPSFPILQDTAAHLDRLRDKPALILWGEKDFVFDKHFLVEWQKQWPNAEIHSFPNAGHYVIEDAKQEIIAYINDFIANH